MSLTSSTIVVSGVGSKCHTTFINTEQWKNKLNLTQERLEGQAYVSASGAKIEPCAGLLKPEVPAPLFGS